MGLGLRSSEEEEGKKNHLVDSIKTEGKRESISAQEPELESNSQHRSPYARLRCIII